MEVFKKGEIGVVDEEASWRIGQIGFDDRHLLEKEETGSQERFLFIIGCQKKRLPAGKGLEFCLAGTLIKGRLRT